LSAWVVSFTCVFSRGIFLNFPVAVVRINRSYSLSLYHALSGGLPASGIFRVVHECLHFVVYKGLLYEMAYPTVFIDPKRYAISSVELALETSLLVYFSFKECWSITKLTTLHLGMSSACTDVTKPGSHMLCYSCFFMSPVSTPLGISFFPLCFFS
jgi:hypothetical protein